MPSTVTRKTFGIRMSSGTDSNGNPIIKSASQGAIRPAAEDTNVLAMANAIATVLDGDVESAYTDSRATLS